MGALLTNYFLVHRCWVPFVCDICSKSFISESHLNRHNMFHYDKRSFPCEQCGKSFFYQKGLERHQRLETGIPCRGIQPHNNWGKRIDNSPFHRVLKVTGDIKDVSNEVIQRVQENPSPSRKRRRNKPLAEKPIPRIRYSLYRIKIF